VENYRQKTPRNAVTIAKRLLEAGADVQAEADVYGGGATTLGLAATSYHPFKAGVQNDLIDVLLKYGGRLDDRGGAGNNHNLVNGCLANGRGHAAAYLASLGATLDLEGAAGVGRLDIVKSHFDEDGGLKPTATIAQVRSGFSWACEYGRAEVVEYLASKGMDLNALLRPNGQTGLHWAAYGGQVEIVRLLLQRGALVDVADERFGTTPTAWALYAWGNDPHAPQERYDAVVELLIDAGAKVKPEWLDHEKVRADPKMQAALSRKQAG
jgi:ankyrin repeat protein